MTELTAIQEKLLREIMKFRGSYKRMPKIREMCAVMGWSSSSVGHKAFHRLIKKGYLGKKGRQFYILKRPS